MKLSNFKAFDNPGKAIKSTQMVTLTAEDFARLGLEINIHVVRFQNADGAEWFGYPQKEYTNKLGEKKYQWMAYFSKDSKPAFEEELKLLLSMEAQNPFLDEEPA
jgi:hypothetical protein